MITIIDYGIGNVGSISNMLKKAGVRSVISNDLSVIEKAEKLILPGVGAFDHGMRQLEIHQMVPLLNYKVLEQKTPILGICLGMQLFSKKSEEGQLPGLSWIDSETVLFKFSKEENLTLPHMSWNSIEIAKKSKIFTNNLDDTRFYFVHSYHMVCKDQSDILAKSKYGIEFTSAVEHNNILGVQFHPEKSHKFGMNVLKNFAELY